MHATAAKHAGGPGRQKHDFHPVSLAPAAREKPRGTEFDPRGKNVPVLSIFQGVTADKGDEGPSNHAEPPT
jgi:hypothetical protein